MKSVRATTGILFTAVLFSLALPSLATAQVGLVPDEECRCVDPDGNEIDNCRCFRVIEPGQFAWSFGDFEPGQFGWSFGGFGSQGARLGITLSVSASDADAQGARVESVMEEGPAARAGIREGDVITHINGISLFDPLDSDEDEHRLDLDGSLPSQRLLHLARELEPGEEVEVRYRRDGERQTTTLEAEDLSDWGGNVMFFGDDWEGQWDAEAFEEQWDAEAFQKQWDMEEFRGQWEEMAEPELFFRRFQEGEPQVFSFGPEGRRFEVGRSGWFGTHDHFNTCPGSEEDRAFVLLGSECIGGLRMEELNPELGEYFGADAGVLVTDVHEDSKLGLESGDVILRVGDRETVTPDALRKILRSYEPEEEITLHILRQKREMTVSGTLAR
jgi:hypothetical protein